MMSVAGNNQNQKRIYLISDLRRWFEGRFQNHSPWNVTIRRQRSKTNKVTPLIAT
jgi:hypothetical protein